MRWLTNLSRTGGDLEYARYRQQMMDDPAIFIGDPQATKDYSVEKLKGFDMIGVYKITPVAAAHDAEQEG